MIHEYQLRILPEQAASEQQVEQRHERYRFRTKFTSALHQDQTVVQYLLYH